MTDTERRELEKIQAILNMTAKEYNEVYEPRYANESWFDSYAYRCGVVTVMIGALLGQTLDETRKIIDNT